MEEAGLELREEYIGSDYDHSSACLRDEDASRQNHAVLHRGQGAGVPITYRFVPLQQGQSVKTVRRTSARVNGSHCASLQQTSASTVQRMHNETPPKRKKPTKHNCLEY
ncbi:MAG TPA: hypothetical protein DEA91_07215 [Paenibacillus sp.]|nr:hypothetical protein [Paenibacillus sp.]